MNELETKPTANISRFLLAANEIADLHGKLVGYMKKSVALIFEIGKVLTEVKEKLDHGEFTPWVEQNCPFDPRTARRYMAVYDRFKTDTVSVLKDKTIAEAYLEAGVKKLAGPVLSDDAEEEEAPEIQTAGDGSHAAWLEAIRKSKPIAADLKRYRVVAGIGEIKFLPPGYNAPMPLAHLFVSPQTRDVLTDAYSALHTELAAAFERYFLQVEQAEDAGLVPAPEPMQLEPPRKRTSKDKAIPANFEVLAAGAGAGKAVAS